MWTRLEKQLIKTSATLIRLLKEVPPVIEREKSRWARMENIAGDIWKKMCRFMNQRHVDDEVMTSPPGLSWRTASTDGRKRHQKAQHQWKCRVKLALIMREKEGCPGGGVETITTNAVMMSVDVKGQCFLQRPLPGQWCQTIQWE